MEQLKIIVLGSAAGGGAPQWNCNTEVSRTLRARNQWRTQSSIAVSANGDDWFLFNASPDIGAQIRHTPALHPRIDQRHSPIKGVVLTNGDVDHVAGLLSLRESHPLVLYATQRVDGVLSDNRIFHVLNPQYVQRRSLELDKSIDLRDVSGRSLGIVIEPFAVPGKVALWLEDASQGDNFGTVEEDTIALKIWNANDPTKNFYYIPACAMMTPALKRRLHRADLVFFDGTLWKNKEMVESKAGIKTGQRMGHMNNSGEKGSIAAFRDMDVKRKIFIHINTTNPLLLDDSRERREANEAGWEVSYDGMEVTL